MTLPADSHLEIIHRLDLDARALRTRVAWEAGAVLATFHGARRVTRPDRYTVQSGPAEHLVLAPEYLRYINHGCDPNVFFDVDTGRLLSLRAIAPGDELTYFYPSTEWDMAEPFECRCGSPRCLRRVTGAIALPREVLLRYRLAGHIRRGVAALTLPSP